MGRGMGGLQKLITFFSGWAGLQKLITDLDMKNGYKSELQYPDQRVSLRLIALMLTIPPLM
jgi:hypothetical protein